MDVCRRLKQSGLDSSFNSGLTVVSLKKEKEKNMNTVSQTIRQELARQAALCRFRHRIDASKADLAEFTSRPLWTFTLNRRASIRFRKSLYRLTQNTASSEAGFFFCK